MSNSKTDKAIQKAADTAIDATGNIADKAEQAIDSARSLANQTLDKADAGVRSLREDLQPAIDAVACRAQDAAQRCRAAVSDGAAQARAQARLYADKTSAYVAEQPLKSMAMAAAAGALLALLLGRRR